MKTRILVFSLIWSLLSSPVLAVGRNNAMYVGGTIQALNQFKNGAEGTLDIKNEEALSFRVKEQTVTVPYEKITGLEYQYTRSYRKSLVGGTVSMPVVAVMAAGATMGLSLVLIPVAAIGAPFLRKGRKKHFLTVAYLDANGKGQALILELGKNIEQETRGVLSARSGKEVRMITEDI